MKKTRQMSKKWPHEAVKRSFKDRTVTIKSGKAEEALPTESDPVRLQKKLAGY